MTPDRFKHYKTGVATLDREHWELFQLINTISAESKGVCSAKLTESKKILIEHLIEHYRREDVEMQTYNYPYARAHIADHTLLIASYREASNVALFNKYTCSDLINKISNHIDHYDTQFADWLLQNIPQID